MQKTALMLSLKQQGLRKEGTKGSELSVALSRQSSAAPPPSHAKHLHVHHQRKSSAGKQAWKPRGEKRTHRYWKREEEREQQLEQIQTVKG